MALPLAPIAGKLGLTRLTQTGVARSLRGAASRFGSTLWGTPARAGFTGVSVGALVESIPLPGIGGRSSPDRVDEQTLQVGVVAAIGLVAAWVLFGGDR